MNGVGRLDIVENRYVGIKSRGCYETPGGTILLKAHRAIESVTLDREVAHYKDRLIPKYAELIYNGFWFSTERIAMQELIDSMQNKVNGHVKLKIFKQILFVITLIVIFVCVDSFYQFLNYTPENGFGRDLLGFKSNWYGIIQRCFFLKILM